MSEPNPELKLLRAELGRVNDLLADARAREVAAVLARFRDEVALLGITEQEVRRALSYDQPTRLPAKYYDPVAGTHGRDVYRRVLERNEPRPVARACPTHRAACLDAHAD
ncbi:hypothetical protein [Paraburkholderia ferrariae]|uniref:hypothetical protein n=1 Tax=Paraburkholderia ferrariae TaxID=386056 RepID=UPI000693BB12|nr:hypothetical protein [Paraburkholderia ferrariae]